MSKTGHTTYSSARANYRVHWADNYWEKMVEQIISDPIIPVPELYRKVDRLSQGLHNPVVFVDALETGQLALKVQGWQEIDEADIQYLVENLLTDMEACSNLISTSEKSIEETENQQSPEELTEGEKEKGQRSLELNKDLLNFNKRKLMNLEDMIGGLTNFEQRVENKGTAKNKDQAGDCPK